MAIVCRVFRFPDGHVERDPIRQDEHYPVGVGEERGGVRFVARKGRVDEHDPNRIELCFFPEDEPPAA